jgi:hypothetical protein
MPITANFNADFSKFFVAVELAQTKLVTFEGEANKVAASLSAMEKSISGVAIVQAATIAAEAVDRLGGVSKLTYAELQRLGGTAQEAVEKMRALGEAVPTKMQSLADRARGASEEMLRLQGATTKTTEATSGWSTAVSTATGVLGAFGISFSVGQVVQWSQAIVGMGKAILDNASALSSMATKTGLSVEQLQRFASAGAAAGVTVNDFTDAAFKLGLALEGGETGVVDAVAKLHLNYQALMNLRPDQQFNAVAKALEAVGNVQERNRLGVELMGKSYSTIAPAIAKGFTDMANQAQVATTQQVEALGRLSDAWAKFVADRKNQATALAGSTVLGAETVAEMTKVQQLLLLLTSGSGNLVEMWDRLRQIGEARAKQIDIELPADTKRLQLTKAQADAAKDYAEALARVQGVGATWQKTLEDVNPWILADIEATVKAGGSLQDLVKVYGLSEAQGRAVTIMIEAQTKAQKDYADVLKEVAKIETDTRAKQEEGVLGLGKIEQEQSQKRREAESKASDEITKLQAAEHDFILRSTLSSTDYQIAKVNEAAAAKIKAYSGVPALFAEYSRLIMADAAREAAAISKSATDALDVVAKKGMDTLALLDLVGRQVQKGLAVDVVGNAAAVGGSGVGMQAPIYVAPPIFARAAGGPVSSGQPYLVGEQGPELFVPTASGGIVPNGRSGVTQNIVIHVNGTAADVARQVSDEIMRAAMRGQQFGAS